MFRSVLMVCTANICRSPMAEALLAARLRALGRPATVASAGVRALSGHPADETAVELLRERGLDISSHRARQLTPELVRQHELILVMDARHQLEVEAIDRTARGRVHRIGRFGGFDVVDPYRRGRAAFEQSLAQIERGLADFEAAFWSRAG